MSAGRAFLELPIPADRLKPIAIHGHILMELSVYMRSIWPKFIEAPQVLSISYCSPSGSTESGCLGRLLPTTISTSESFVETTLKLF